MALSSTFEADFTSFVKQCEAAADALAAVAKSADQVKASAAGAESGLDPAKPKAFAGELGKVGGNMNDLIGYAKQVGAAFGVTFAASTLVDYVRQVFALADAYVNVAKATGMTTTEVQRLDAVAASSGLSLDDVAKAVTRIERALETVKGQTAIEDLGLDFVELRAALPYDRIGMVADALGEMTDASERNRAAIALLGPEGAKLATMLDSELRAKLADVTVATEESTAAAAALANMWTTATGALQRSAIDGLGTMALAMERIKGLGFGEFLNEMWLRGMAGDGIVAFYQGLARAQIELDKTAAAAKRVFGPDAAADWDFGKGPEPGNPFDTTPKDREAMGSVYTKMLADEAAEAKKLADALEEVDAARKGSAAILAELGEATVAAIQHDLDLKLGQETLATVYGLTKAEIKAVAEAYELEKKSLRTVVDAYQDFYREREARSQTTTEKEIAAINQWATDTKQKLRDAGESHAQYYADVDDVAAQKLAAVGVNWDALREKSDATLRDTMDRAVNTYTEAANASGSFSKKAIEDLQRVALDATIQFNTMAAAGDKMYAAWLAGEKAYSDAVKRFDAERAGAAGAAADANAAAMDQAIAYAQAYGVTLAEAQKALGQMPPTANELKKETGGAADEAGRLTVAFNDAAGAAKLTVYEMLQATLAVDEAYRKAGIFVADVGSAASTLNWLTAVRAGVGIPTNSGQFGDAVANAPGRGVAWGTGRGATSTTNTLNVNVNSHDAEAIAEKLVTEMRHQGVRF